MRDKHGNEAQREKFGRKADKLIAEVYALKTIKDDDISKFGILDERSLTKILQDQSSSSSVRIMARVAHYKTLSRRLIQFKEKFPDCKKHFEEKKKTTKLKDKGATKTRKSKENNSQNKSSKKEKVDLDKNVETQHNSSTNEEACNNGLSEARRSSRKRKKTLNEDYTSLEKQKLLKLEEDGTSEATVVDRQSSVIKPSSVTKEATVKRFTELLEEQEANQDAPMSVESQDPAGTATEQVKTVDDFFLTEDDQNYQGNSASTSYTNVRRSQRHNTRAKAFQSNDRVKKQNANRKNDTNFNKKHPSKQSFSMKSKKMASNKINKNANKSNANEKAIVNKKDENASLHPSWMAKKKQQEIMSHGFQGKKIVFTND